MIVFDVNVLVYAHRVDSPNHSLYLKYLNSVVKGSEAFGLSHSILSGFLRVVTHPKIFKPPSRFSEAMEFVRQIQGDSKCLLVSPGARHWEIFLGLCRKVKARGNMIPDAYLAAMVIESGNELITSDQGFSVYPDLKWRHPLGE